jgi:TatA/E family protein of Tat protein translocase
MSAPVWRAVTKSRNSRKFFRYFSRSNPSNSFMTFSLAFIEGIGGPELMMVLFVVLLLFGADRLPELARGVGKSMREFKKAASGVEHEVRRAMEEEPAKPAPKPPGTVQAAAEPPAPPAATD